MRNVPHKLMCLNTEFLSCSTMEKLVEPLEHGVSLEKVGKLKETLHSLGFPVPFMLPSPLKYEEVRDASQPHVQATIEYPDAMFSPTTKDCIPQAMSQISFSSSWSLLVHYFIIKEEKK